MAHPLGLSTCRSARRASPARTVPRPTRRHLSPPTAPAALWGRTLRTTAPTRLGFALCVRLRCLPRAPRPGQFLVSSVARATPPRSQAAPQPRFAMSASLGRFLCERRATSAPPVPPADSSPIWAAAPCWTAQRARLARSRTRTALPTAACARPATFPRRRRRRSAACARQARSRMSQAPPAWAIAPSAPRASTSRATAPWREALACHALEARTNRRPERTPRVSASCARLAPLASRQTVHYWTWRARRVRAAP